jgi:hypothetical protein
MLPARGNPSRRNYEKSSEHGIGRRSSTPLANVADFANWAACEELVGFFVGGGDKSSMHWEFFPIVLTGQFLFLPIGG